MNLSKHREWARFYSDTSPEVAKALDDMAELAVGATEIHDRMKESSGHLADRLAFLTRCAEEFYLVGEVVAVPQEGQLPRFIYPGQVGVVAKPDGTFLLHWTNGSGTAKTLPPETIYLRRPTTPFDMRGVPAILPDGTVQATDMDTELFAQQAGPLIAAVGQADLGPEPEGVMPEDEDTGEKEMEKGPG